MLDRYDTRVNSPHFVDWLKLQDLKRDYEKLKLEHEELKMAINPNNTKQAVEYLRQLRKMGYAVVAFTPDELRGATPDHVEDRLIEIGWDVIANLATEPDPDAPPEKDWNWVIK